MTLKYISANGKSVQEVAMAMAMASIAMAMASIAMAMASIE